MRASLVARYVSLGYSTAIRSSTAITSFLSDLNQCLLRAVLPLTSSSCGCSFSLPPSPCRTAPFLLVRLFSFATTACGGARCTRSSSLCSLPGLAPAHECTNSLCPRWRPATNETSFSRKAPCTRTRLHPHMHFNNESTLKIAFNLLAAALRCRMGREEFC